MKRTLTYLFGFLMMITALAPIGSASLGDMKTYSAGDKLNRGLLNIVSSPLEVARSINEGNHANGYGYGWTVGLLRGFGWGAVRLGDGLLETVTFPFDFPKQNKAPIVKPEFVWQDWGQGPQLD